MLTQIHIRLEDYQILWLKERYPRSGVTKALRQIVQTHMNRTEEAEQIAASTVTPTLTNLDTQTDT